MESSLSAKTSRTPRDHPCSIHNSCKYLGKLPEQVWRVAAYPFLGIFVAEALLPSVLAFDPKFGNLHLLTVLIGSLVAVVVDWVIRQARHPSLVLTPEARAAVA